MLTDAQRTEFDERGFVRVPAAFERDLAKSMEDHLWEVLGDKYGALRDDPATWNVDYVTGLRALRGKGEFEGVGSTRTREALDDLLGIDCWQEPSHWGQFLVSFPTGDSEWTVPHRMWHTDYPYLGPTDFVFGALVFSFISDVPRGAGGTVVVAGSHRVVRAFVETRSREELAKTKMKRMRHRLLQSDPWLSALASPQVRTGRNERFVDAEHQIGDVTVRVDEVVGEAGDVVIAHPWILHASGPNCGEGPRLMRVGRLRCTRRPPAAN